MTNYTPPTVQTLKTDLNVCRDLKTNEDLFLWTRFNNGVYVITEMNGKRTFNQDEVFTINGRNFCLIGSQIFETPSGIMEEVEEDSRPYLEIMEKKIDENH